MNKIATTIHPTAPFDFELTAGYHTYFQGRHGVDSLMEGVYRRLLDLGDKLVLASVRSTGSIEEPELEMELQGEGLTDGDAVIGADKVAWLLGASQDLKPFYALAGEDSTLQASEPRVRCARPPHARAQRDNRGPG